MTNETPEWRALIDRQREMTSTSLGELFGNDPGRARALTFEVDGLLADLSKHLIDDATIDLLLDLAEEAGLPDRIEAMYRGDHINSTEDRAVLAPGFAALDDRERFILHLRFCVDFSDHVKKLPCIQGPVEVCLYDSILRNFAIKFNFERNIRVLRVC